MLMNTLGNIEMHKSRHLLQCDNKFFFAKPITPVAQNLQVGRCNTALVAQNLKAEKFQYKCITIRKIRRS